MLEKALSGNRSYWTWVLSLAALVGVGFLAYLYQYENGLAVTGMNREVSWGFYIAQFTFLVGVAASAVMLVIPYYLHHYKTFGRIVILGEFLAISAVIMCITFIVVDLGQPQRIMNVLLHPTPHSILFWDMIVLNGYLAINLVVGWTTLAAERKGVPPAKWVKPLIYLSVPWAVSIHTVTAFLYCGLPGRHFWLTAILAPRFLASAFASGPSVLILMALIVRKFTKFDAGNEAIRTLGKIVAYAICLNLFFVALEVFTSFYSNIPGHMIHFQYLFSGVHGHGILVPWMWASIIFGLIAVALLVVPQWRNNLKILPVACCLVFASTWIDKGLGMIAGGFVPNPLHEVVEYAPTAPELMITLGIWAMGALILTVLYKVATGVKVEVEL
ncbi:sulfate reduction electron transfer complex DsrMKJOP subunit DsrP [Dethiosulfatarculus sandiegensis]|uniref:Hdr menaquinol oxidoreductase integral membrane subunit n=1 Tax=Dethiosulfatarculus sandiegensis TaxID=1429043 RepID=A0A0D2JV79_9BACT|nr:NrfD/PsrC family molybdoenzyme membrane anchor subunit [Dethiosulfatarculus sandiegensis]KIX13465.1 Hdr menaquinol oxidoreductase integral membrane subunit [Dethiosulfatarculus sandiegensis]